MSEPLNGDPRAEEDLSLFTELGPFVAWTHRELKTIINLMNAQRTAEALLCTEGVYIRTAMTLLSLGLQPLPEIAHDAPTA